jgi:hypothetical protein
VAATVALLALCGCSGLAGGSAAAAACPNEAERIEQGATGLPACRAFELVTPGALLGEERLARAASGGGAVTYFTNHPAPDAGTSAHFYLARRQATGWSREGIGFQNAAAAQFGAICEQNVYFSPDLSKNVLEAGWFEAGEPSRCKHTEAPIVTGEPTPYRNVFLQDRADGSTRLVNLTPPTAIPANAKFQDASDDLSHIVFAEAAKLTAEAPAGYALYLWHDGAVRLATFLPDGTPAAGLLAEATSHQEAGSFVRGSGFAPLTGATSADGRRLFFYSGEGLYLRENADQPQSATLAGECIEPTRACTVQVDASQGPGPSGGGVFWRATPDASTVFFTDEHRLTADSTAASGKADLYRYDVGSGQLTDLTVDAGAAADVRGVVGMAADGSRLYFVANGALAPGSAVGNCQGSFQAPGQCSLYLLAEGGTISFVARLSGREPQVWQESFESVKPREKGTQLWANVSPNGRYLVFLSQESLTGYDNYDSRAEAFDPELFRFDAVAGALACLTCPPGAADNPFNAIASTGNYGPNAAENASWMRNSVLDDGTVFFNTRSALLAADTNGEDDVYEYSGGAVHLISSGGFSGGARFLDASPDGTDVFFRTAESLVAADTDSENNSLYDARAGGGFAALTPPPPPCADDACRPPSAPPAAIPVPATDSAGAAPARPKACRHGQRRRHRCGKRHQRRGGKPGHRRQRGAAR